MRSFYVPMYVKRSTSPMVGPVSCCFGFEYQGPKIGCMVKKESEIMAPEDHVNL